MNLSKQDIEESHLLLALETFQFHIQLVHVYKELDELRLIQEQE